MKKSKHIGSILFLILLIGLTFFFLLKNLDLADLGNIIAGVKIGYLILGMVLIALFLCGEALVFRLVMKKTGHPISFKSSYIYAAIDYYFSCITPSANGGQPAQIYYMNKDGVPLSKTGVAIFVYGFIYKAVLILFGIAAVCLVPAFIFDSGPLMITLFFFGVICDVGVFALLLTALLRPTLLRRPVFFFIRLFAKLRLVSDLDKALEGAEKQLEDYREASCACKKSPSLLISSFLIVLVQRTIQYSIGYIVYLGLGLSGESFFTLFCIQVISAFAADSLPLPGGIGASEAIHLSLYSRVYFETSLRSGAMLLTRGLNYYFLLILSAAVSIANIIRLALRERKTSLIEK